MAWGKGGRPRKERSATRWEEPRKGGVRRLGPGQEARGLRTPPGACEGRGCVPRAAVWASASSPTHQSLCFGVTSSSVVLTLLLRVGGRDCKTSGQSQPGTESPQRLRLFHPNLSTPSHPPRFGTSKRDGSCYPSVFTAGATVALWSTAPRPSLPPPPASSHQ